MTWESTLSLDPEERTIVNVNLTGGASPSWLPWVQWGLMGLGGAMIASGGVAVGAGWARFQDSEAMYGEISAGRFSSRVEEDLMWARYGEMFDQYNRTWAAGWAVFGVGLAAALASATMLILDRVFGLFGGHPEAEIDLIPLDDAEDEEAAELDEDASPELL
jgi:hypothetical protein